MLPFSVIPDQEAKRLYRDDIARIGRQRDVEIVAVVKIDLRSAGLARHHATDNHRPAEVRLETVAPTHGNVWRPSGTNVESNERRSGTRAILSVSVRIRYRVDLGVPV